jgi:hypothetical protein
MLRLRLGALVAALTLAACAGQQSPRGLAAAAAGSSAPPQRNVTRFADGLRCMDDLMYRFGVRDVSVMIEEMQDQSRRLGAGTRDMMVSAFADMTRRSRGVRLVTFGQDNQNVVQLLQVAQKLNDFKVVPQFDIRGSITQFDEDVVREEAGLGASLVSAVTGPLFGVRFNRSRQASVLGFDASVITTADLALLPGASSRNTVVVQREDNSLGDGQAVIRNGSLSFTFGVSRSEAVAQSVRTMIELASIELTGKLLRLPYWGCLGVDQRDREVQREMDDWYFALEGTPELTRFFQEQLRNRRFYDGPLDGKSNPAYEEALAAYRVAVGTSTEGVPDFRVWQAFLLRPLPVPPAQPFAAAAGAVAQSNAAGGAAPLGLNVKVAKGQYREGEPIELTVTTAADAYVYCYVQSPDTGKIQRIFPNRFTRDPHVSANTPLALPGAQGFKFSAGGEGAKVQAVGCLATEREIYNELPPTLRWGDFEDVRLGTFEEIRGAFAQVAKEPVAMEGGTIEVVRQ